MTKYRRTKMYIERNKKLKEERRAEKYKDNDNFGRVMTTQHFIDALTKCRKGVSWKGSVQIYTANAISQIYSSREELLKGKLPALTSIKRIVLYERGKRRVICPITISDRMIQRVLCDNALVPRLRDILIYDNGASMKDKGVDFTRKRLMHHIEGAIRDYGTEFYALTFDFKGFFDSIPHRTCLNVLSDTFIDTYIRSITMDIIKSYQKSMIQRIKDKASREEHMALLENNKLCGITLGSQVSQIMALVVPNKLDHYIKDEAGVKHYVRYMDDGVIFSDSKEYLHSLYAKMRAICDELGLTFNDKKTRIVKVSRGFVFMKIRYNVTKTGGIVRRLTKAGIIRMRRKIKKFRRLVDTGAMTMDDVFNSVQSWFAHARIAKSYHAQKNMTKLYNELFDGYKLTKKYQHVKGGKNGELLQDDRWRDFRWDSDAA